MPPKNNEKKKTWVDELKIARILRLIAADNNTECKRAKNKCLLSVHFRSPNKERSWIAIQYGGGNYNK